MSKFKVGDKVEFIGDVSEHIFSDILDNHKDDLVICKVCKNEKSYHVKPLGINDTKWCFDDDELELLEEQVDKVDSLYPYLVQPNFKLSPELQHEWKKLEKNSYTGKLCGKNLFDGATWKNDFYEKYILGIWGKEDEKDMNKVLNLWFERKQEKIIKKYAEMEQDFINNHYSVVKSYNELVEQFEKDLDDLYKFDKVNEQFVLEEISDKNTIKYDIDFDKLSCEFTDKHIKEKQGELKELAKIREEVEAQLSLSNELKYQQEVLIQYNIIDKKTKKIVE